MLLFVICNASCNPAPQFLRPDHDNNKFNMVLGRNGAFNSFEIKLLIDWLVIFSQVSINIKRFTLLQPDAIVRAHCIASNVHHKEDEPT